MILFYDFIYDLYNLKKYINYCIISDLPESNQRQFDYFFS
jgi:nucleoside diphosphate kinase